MDRIITTIPLAYLLCIVSYRCNSRATKNCFLPGEETLQIKPNPPKGIFFLRGCEEVSAGEDIKDPPLVNQAPDAIIGVNGSRDPNSGSGSKR